MPLQHGGVVTRPTLSLLGERGPEAVVPLSQLGAAGADGGVSVINLMKEADLAAVVSAEMAKGRGVIVNDFMDGLRGNRVIRRGVQRFGR